MLTTTLLVALALQPAPDSPSPEPTEPGRFEPSEPPEESGDSTPTPSAPGRFEGPDAATPEAPPPAETAPATAPAEPPPVIPPEELYKTTPGDLYVGFRAGSGAIAGVSLTYNINDRWWVEGAAGLRMGSGTNVKGNLGITASIGPEWGKRRARPGMFFSVSSSALWHMYELFGAAGWRHRIVNRDGKSFFGMRLGLGVAALRRIGDTVSGVRATSSGFYCNSALGDTCGAPVVLWGGFTYAGRTNGGRK